MIILFYLLSFIIIIIIYLFIYQDIIVEVCIINENELSYLGSMVKLEELYTIIEVLRV